MKFDLKNRNNRIFFLYKVYLLELNSTQAQKELHEENYFYDFTSLQEETILFILKNRDSLEENISAKLKDWKFNRIPFLEQALLLNAAAEIILFKNKKAIIINETVKFSKDYCDLDSYKYINAILEAIN